MRSCRRRHKWSACGKAVRCTPYIRDVTAPALSCHRTLLSLYSQCPRVRATHVEGGFTDWDSVDHAVNSILLSLGSRAHGSVRHETTHSKGQFSRRTPLRQGRAANLRRLSVSGGFVQRLGWGIHKVAKWLGGDAWLAARRKLFELGGP